MRHILLIFLLCFSTTAMAETKPYPDKWEQFSSFDDLQNVYWKNIYLNTNYEDEKEVIERLKWHQKTFESYKDEFTEHELNLYRKLEVPQISIENNDNWLDQVRKSKAFSWYYNYEKELLRLENDIDFRNWIETIFTNDTMVDSPFDVIRTLHSIELVLFGEKY